MNDNSMNKEFNEACKPLVDFLYKYGTPHSTIVVTQADAQFSNGECATVFELRD